MKEWRDSLDVGQRLWYWVGGLCRPVECEVEELIPHPAGGRRVWVAFFSIEPGMTMVGAADLWNVYPSAETCKPTGASPIPGDEKVCWAYSGG